MVRREVALNKILEAHFIMKRISVFVVGIF